MGVVIAASWVPAGCSSPNLALGDQRRLNWDRPFARGLDVPPAEVNQPGPIRHLGGLSFTPIVPNFGVAPVLVQVAPTTSVAFVYRFPRSAEFPIDGRVDVYEGIGGGPADIVRMAVGNSKLFPGDVTLIRLGNGLPVVIDHAHGRADAQLNLPGHVYVSIAGPALTQATVTELARTFDTTG